MRRGLVFTVLGTLVLATLLGVGTLASIAGAANDAAEKVRWDIVSVNPPTDTTIDPGGKASARASDNSKITVTGSGTFVFPGGTRSSAPTGGGTWETFDSSGASTGKGTYKVKGLVTWHKAPGTPPPGLTDNIDNRAKPSAGLAVLVIGYSDGSRGILVVSCHLVGTPDSVFEGITATKDFVDYWNPEPPIPGVDANRTLFHILRPHNNGGNNGE